MNLLVKDQALTYTFLSSFPSHTFQPYLSDAKRFLKLGPESITTFMMLMNLQKLFVPGIPYISNWVVAPLKVN